VSPLPDDPAQKEAYLNAPYHSPENYLRFMTGLPYRWHLDDLVSRAIREVGTTFHDGVEFNLFNRWEAEYIQEQMAKRCPQIQYRMKWHFGGPLKDDSDAEKVCAGHDGTDLQN
jgi:hypothetical protein